MRAVRSLRRAAAELSISRAMLARRHRRCRLARASWRWRDPDRRLAGHAGVAYAIRLLRALPLHARGQLYLPADMCAQWRATRRRVQGNDTTRVRAELAEWRLCAGHLRGRRSEHSPRGGACLPARCAGAALCWSASSARLRAVRADRACAMAAADGAVRARRWIGLREAF